MLISLYPQSPDREVEVDAVLDLDGYGDLFGVEVLDAARSANVDPSLFRLEDAATSGASITYDPEVDALYVRVRQGVSYHQTSARARLGFGGNRLVQIDVPGIPAP